MKLILRLAAAAFAVAGAQATAGPIVLTFEGIPNNTPVGAFYAGEGIVFSNATLALVDSDAGGSGNFANEPSPNTIIAFTAANDAVLNYAAGFTTGFSFYYTSSTAAPINIYDGVGATGNLLATINLTAQYNGNGCHGDPTGAFCNFTPIGVTFAGTARSIDFGGTADQTGYDNITFGSASPGSGTPEPAAWALMLAGFGLVGATLRRRREEVAAA